MTEGKYVVRADGSVRLGDRRTSIHAYMACSCPEEDCEGRAVSAGFFTVVDGKVVTSGISTSLGGIRPADGDDKLIEQELLQEKTIEGK